MKLKIVNRRNLIRYAVVVGLLFCCWSCDEEKNEPLASGGSTPGQVEIGTVICLAGGAEIPFKAPADPNLLYVEAELTTPQGKTIIYKASSYARSITILGLADVSPQEVKIYSVSKSLMRSEPVIFTFTPLEPPYREVLRSLKMVATFGGVRLNYQNPTGAELAYYLGYFDEKGDFTEYNDYYTGSKSDTTYVFYGLPSEERKFAVYIRDKYNNNSDTLFAYLTPQYEVQIPKTGFAFVQLDNDGPFYAYDAEPYIRPQYLWDGIWSTNYSNPYLTGTSYAYMNYSVPASNDPTSFTFSLGASYSISRIRVNNYWQYQMSGARKWEVWACSETPPQDGNWEWSGWIKLAYMEQIKPSGLPPGPVAGEGDAEAWVQGTSAESISDIPVKYIRIRALEAWSGRVAFCASEITLFGAQN